jgi:phospholipase/lecithinase/hemolysin
MQRAWILAGLVLVAAFAVRSIEADTVRPFDEIIIFGASMSDNGNAYIITDGAYGGPPNYLGRFSNGPVWVERLAEDLGFGTATETSPLPAPSEAGGTNYAVAGASTGWMVSRLGATGMGKQVEYFFEDGRTLDGDELIVMQGGGNESSAMLAANNVLQHIATLAAAGGKHFLVDNYHRISQAPGVVQDGWADTYVVQYGQHMAAGLDELEDEYDITVYRFDMLGLNDDMIANPGDYGLTNTTDALRASAGGDPDEYLWWDTHHFTAKVHKIFADAAASLILD